MTQTAFPMNLYSSEQIRQAIKRALPTLAHGESELMERAGEACFDCLKEHWPDANSIAILCGNGNNGGDGIVLARLAQQAGMEVKVYLLADAAQFSASTDTAHRRWQAMGGRLQPIDLQTEIQADLIVDAYLGTGCTLPLSEGIKRLIKKINQLDIPVFSIDIPSGVMSDTGAVDEIAIQAEITLSLLALKPGLFTGHGTTYVGELFFDDLELPQNLFKSEAPIAQIIDNDAAFSIAPVRQRNCHKGDFGPVLCIGGTQVGHFGAIHLSAKAALRVGAGTVKVVTHPHYVLPLTAAVPELMVYPLNEADEAFIKPKVVLIGPGLVANNDSKKALEMAGQQHCPLVVDAGAFELIKKLHLQNENWILTPHPGEAAFLLDADVRAVQNDRISAVKALVNRYKGVVVLKGAGTVIGFDGKVLICDSGHSGMATAGMGDVLAGIIAGLLASNLSLVDAAVLGTVLHANAGETLSESIGSLGYIASDLIDILPAELDGDEDPSEDDIDEDIEEDDVDDEDYNDDE